MQLLCENINICLTNVTIAATFATEQRLYKTKASARDSTFKTNLLKTVYKIMDTQRSIHALVHVIIIAVILHFFLHNSFGRT